MSVSAPKVQMGRLQGNEESKGSTMKQQAKPVEARMLRRALRALADPRTLVWVLVLLVNDHWLRWSVPDGWRWLSWVAGKLGDVAWLAFAPLIVAVVLVMLAPGWRWLVQRRTLAPDTWVIGVAIALVGGVFALVNASPAAAVVFARGFRAIFGWRPLLVRDPTDLLTLPALALAWSAWQRAASTQGPRWRVRIRLGWWVLGLAALATLANAGPPDEGLVCVTLDGGRILAGPRHAYAVTPNYVSADGGLTWSREAEIPDVDGPARCPVREPAWTLALPEADRFVYRFTSGEGVARSIDGGTTYETELDLRGEDARMAYYQITRMTVVGGPGPHDAVFDPASGNLVVAMGHEGVLVRTAARATTGTWQWIAVGDYRPEPLTSVGQVATLLRGELGLALSVLCVTLGLASWRLLRTAGRSIAVVWAVGLLLALGILRPALVSGYGAVIVLGLVGAFTLGALVLAVFGGVRIYRRGTPGGLPDLAAALGVALVSALLFLAPLVAWSVGLIAAYRTAMWITLVVTMVAWLAAGTLGAGLLSPPRLAS